MTATTPTLKSLDNEIKRQARQIQELSKFVKESSQARQIQELSKYVRDHSQAITNSFTTKDFAIVSKTGQSILHVSFDDHLLRFTMENSKREKKSVVLPFETDYSGFKIPSDYEYDYKPYPKFPPPK
jgi:hypothetical protein